MFCYTAFYCLSISAIRKVKRFVLNLCAVYFSLNQKKLISQQDLLVFFFFLPLEICSVTKINGVLIAVGNAENFAAYKKFLVLFTKPLAF